MNFEDHVSRLAAGVWSIGLETHMGTSIANETSRPNLKIVSAARKIGEERFAGWYRRVRNAMAGYNCFGMVFAARRTAIYEDEGPVVGSIL